MVREWLVVRPAATQQQPLEIFDRELWLLQRPEVRVGEREGCCFGMKGLGGRKVEGAFSPTIQVYPSSKEWRRLG